MIKNANISSENCKSMLKIVKNTTKNRKIRETDIILTNLGKSNLELLSWIKTLICVHDNLPNIIKLLDKIIMAKSTSAVSGSLIFGDHKYGTYGQVEELLKLEDRKVSIINLYTLINTMVDALKPSKKKFVELKFYRHKTVEYIAEELQMDERSVYRWTNSVYKELLCYCLNNNWTTEFICNQLCNEGWLSDHYQKHYNYFLKMQKAD